MPDAAPPGSASSRSERSSSPRILPAGTSIENFRIMRPIARGGMGDVYLARDTRLGRRVALKIIRTDYDAAGEDEAETNPLLFEAQTIARFSHPNIVTVFAVGEHHGRPWLALEYLRGQNLEERLDERSPSLGETLRIASAIAAALAEAHASGVLHLDLKPANVIIPSDGRPRVLDFGLARIVRGDTAAGETEQAAVGWGTPAYTAPEQWRRLECTGATDVWSLGIMLFQMLSGDLPYAQPSVLEQGRSICSKARAPRLADRAEAPPELDELVAHCLAKDPDDRPTATEVLEVLEELLATPSRAQSNVEESPFRGLLPFTSRHASHFFGREAEVAAFVELARHHPVLPIVGPSGAGKSSFVQAGVIPRLHEQGDWTVLRLRPGARPFETLVDRLRRRDAPAGALSSFDDDPASSSSFPIDDPQRSSPPGLDLSDDRGILVEELRKRPRQLSQWLRRLAEETGRNVLLLVEQLEELYSMVADDEVRRAFVTALCVAADDPLEPVRVIFTVRDDYLGRLPIGPHVREVLAHMTVMQPLDAGALEQVLVAPVEALGYRYEDPSIVQRMSDAVAGEPGSLPLLQFAAQKLWEQRDTERRLLLTSAYEELGGVEGALAKHADGVLDGLSTEEKRVARALLMRLVTPQRTRRSVGRPEALEGLGEAGPPVLDRLAQARLIAIRRSRDRDEPLLELAHESLAVRWTTLSRWVTESRDELQFVAEAKQAAELWEQRGRRPDELWIQDALRDAERRRSRCRGEVPAIVDQFLAAGRHRERVHQRRRRFLQGTVIAASLSVAAAAAFAAYTIAEKEQVAIAERDRAASERATALREAAKAAASQDETLEARAKLRVALTVEDAPLGRALWRALREDPRMWRKQLGSLVYDVDVAPDGRTLAVGCQDTGVYLVDTVTRETRILRGSGDQVYAVAWAPDGATLASASWSGNILLWDPDQPRPRRVLAGHTASVQALAYSADGRWLVSGGEDHTVRRWDVGSGTVSAEYDAEAAVAELALSGDSRRLAAATDNGVMLWTEGEPEPHRFDEGRFDSVAFSPDGTQLAAGGDDTELHLWRIDDGEELQTMSSHAAGIRGVVFDPAGELLVSGSYDKTIRVWRVATGELLRTLEAHDAGVTALALDADGTHLASTGRDRTVRLWDLERTGRRERTSGHEAGVYRVQFSPDGKTIASGSGDKTLRLWDVASGQEKRVITGHTEGVDSIAFSPDGTRLASGSIDLTVRIWDVASGAERRIMTGHEARVAGLAFSPDGEHLASAGRDGQVRVWDASTGAQLARLDEHEGAVFGVGFSPDGRLLASGAADGHVRIWNTTGWTLAAVMRGHTAAVHGVAFDPRGRWLASGGGDRVVRLWDPGTGRHRVLGPHGGRVYWIAVDREGAHVGAPASDGSATVWDVEEGTRRVLQGHSDEVNSMAFSPDGRLVASAADDGTVRVWEMASGRPFWHAPLLLPTPPRLLSHQGWRALDPARGGAPPESSRWRETVQQRARLADHHVSGLTCIATHDGAVALWSLPDDAALSEQTLPGVRDVRATEGGCLVRADEGAWTVARDGTVARLDLPGPITAIDAMNDGSSVAVSERTLAVFDASGEPVMRASVPPGVTAVASLGAGFVIGFRDGNLTRLDASGTSTRASFEEVPASRVERIVAGPPGTLVAGYANGSVGMWGAHSGARLATGRLHGRVVHLLVDEVSVVAATDLGHHLVWDTTVFGSDYCELLREVWSEVPVIWASGQVVEVEPPADHPCSL